MEKQPLVIILNGYAGSGKDTMIKLLSKKVNKCITLSSIDIIKDVCYLLGWDGIKTPHGRKFLSDIKDLAVWYNDLPLKVCKDFYNQNLDADIIVFQIRESKEIEKALKLFPNSKSLLLTREYDADKPYQSDDFWNCGLFDTSFFEMNYQTALKLLQFESDNGLNDIFIKEIWNIIERYKLVISDEAQAKNNEVMKTNYDFTIENNGTLEQLDEKLNKLLC